MASRSPLCAGESGHPHRARQAAMLDWNIAFSGLVPIGVLAFATWIASVVQRDVSLVDRAWGVLIASAAVAYFVLLAGHSGEASTSRGTWMLALVCIWVLRLSAYIT